MLRGSEYIEQVMVIGENEKQAAAIISPNFNTLHYWALKYKLHYRDNAELISLPQVHDKYRKELDNYNKTLAPHEQIKQFRLVVDDWNPNNGLLSPTLKLRRGPLMEKYKDLVAPGGRHLRQGENLDQLVVLGLPFGRVAHHAVAKEKLNHETEKSTMVHVVAMHSMAIGLRNNAGIRLCS